MAIDKAGIGCNSLMLCEGVLGTVTLCPASGQVQLALGYLSLRLQPEAFRELTGMLVLALQRLSAPMAAAPVWPVPHSVLH